MSVNSSSQGPVTMRTIAERAGVSIGTVSHVLNSTAIVRPHLRQKVEQAIEELGYQRSELARGLRRRSTAMIGMIIPDIGNPFFPEIVSGAEDVAFQSGFRLVLCNSKNDAKRESIYLEELTSFQPAGLIVIPSADTDIVDSLKKQRSPMVFADRCPDNWSGDFVSTDNYAGGVAAGEHIFDMGHRRIAMLGPQNVSAARERFSGFRHALQARGVKISSENIMDCSFDAESGVTATLRLLRSTKDRPTAIFAANDLIASGVLAALHKAGFKCPDDISVIGFDDLDHARLSTPGLTTIRQPGYQLGAKACQLLIDRTQGVKGPVQRMLLEAELVVRDSVRLMPFINDIK